MFKFFRAIRESIVMQDKTNKPISKTNRYLKYAVGEIILVVIGILIALQINNWNQERLTAAENQAILRNLNKEFSENLIELDASLIKLNIVVEGLQELLEIMGSQEKDVTESDFDGLLAKTFSTPSWTPSSFVLVELKNSGALTKLNNNAFKTMLFGWEREFDKMQNSKQGYTEYASDYIEFITKHGSVRNLDAMNEAMKGLQKSVIGKNDPALLKNPEFENRVDNFYFLASKLRSDYRSLKVLMTNIIQASKAKTND